MTLLETLGRIGLYSGVTLFGVASVLPNAMLSDSGTSSAATSAHIGLLASSALTVGGILGVLGIPYHQQVVVGGVALQVGALTYAQLTEWLRERERAEKD